MENGTKVCVSCFIEKPLAKFSYRTDTGKYRGQCKQCHKGYKTDLAERQEFIRTLKAQGLKKCGKCNEIKKLEQFNNDKSTVTGKTSYCKNCIAVKTAKTSTKRKDYRLQRIYGITLDDYESIAFKQVHRCDICGIQLLELDPQHVHLDHCHLSGGVRGLLCSNCNIGLGNFKDDIIILKMQ